MARLFVGVELEAGVKAAAAAAADELRRQIATAGIRMAARWAPEDNLHLTVWFIGELPDDRAQKVQEVLAPPFALPSFSIRLAAFGAFPPSGAPRVLWIGLAAGADQMRALHAETGQRLGPLGYQPERRPYSAHLTVARVKALSSRADIPGIRRALVAVSADAGVSRVTAVTLFRSRLSPKGAVYEPVLRVPLG